MQGSPCSPLSSLTALPFLAVVMMGVTLMCGHGAPRSLAVLLSSSAHTACRSHTVSSGCSRLLPPGVTPYFGVLLHMADALFMEMVLTQYSWGVHVAAVLMQPQLQVCTFLRS